VLFSRVRPISDDISADISGDNFVLVVNAREYKTREKQKSRRRLIHRPAAAIAEASRGFPPPFIMYY
jgi:hypothetical protein